MFSVLESCCNELRAFKHFNSTMTNTCYRHLVSLNIRCIISSQPKLRVGSTHDFDDVPSTNAAQSFRSRISPNCMPLCLSCWNIKKSSTSNCKAYRAGVPEFVHDVCRKDNIFLLVAKAVESTFVKRCAHKFLSICWTAPSRKFTLYRSLICS